MTALLQNYNRAPLTFVRGEGCELIDDRGERYLDLIGGIAVCALGHAHPEVARAVASQAATLVHASNLFEHEPAGRLAAELARRSGFDRVFFCNSGTEANEAAIKLARKYAYRRGETERTTILSCTGGFHGRTLGALAATPNAAYQEGFGPLPGGFRTTPFNDLEALEINLDESVAALLIEPVQGESGVHPADPAFLRAARKVCTQRGALLVFDEIQCGMGRLGPTFAFQYFGVEPDAITLAKSLANGLPIGAVLLKEALAGALRPGDHGSTFGGSPVPCAAALAHLRVRDVQMLEARVPVASARLFDGLRALALRYDDVFDAPRGIGLLIGLPVRSPYDASDLVDALRERHVLANKAGGNTLRFAPPLVIEDAQIDRALADLGAATDATRRRSRISH
ncbi:MAG: aspartate aminotransferase family protein [Vulcanimicrobiaceae bacterium]